MGGTVVTAMSLGLLAVLAESVVAPGTGIDVGTAVELSPDGTYSSGLAAAGDRTGVVVTWISSVTRTGKNCAFARMLGPAAQPVGKPIELSCAATTPPRIAVGGRAPLIIWGEYDRLVGATLTSSGTKPAFRTGPLDRHPDKTVTAWDGTRYWVAWSDGIDLYLQQASPAGALVGKPNHVNQRWADPHLQISEIALPCAGSSCALACTIFLGNSTFQRYAWPIRNGKLGERAAFGEGPFANVQMAWQLELPTFAKHPFFGDDINAAEPVGAETSAGALVAWGGIRFGFVAANPAHARHTPIELTGETEPHIAATDATHFVLVTGGRKLRARPIKVDPAYFAKVPLTRPPVATGAVIASDGSPATGARLHFRVRFQDGTGIESCCVPVSPDGSFAIPHPEKGDHRPGKDVLGVELWADRGAEVAPPQSGAAGAQMRFQLAAPAQLAGTIAGGRGVDVELTIEVQAPDSTLASQHILWNRSLTARDAFELHAVPSGRASIRARARDGRTAAAMLTLAPGQRTNASLSLAPAGALVLSVVDTRGPVDVFPTIEGMDVDELLASRRNGQPLEFERLAAGPHLIVLQDDRWQMTRRFTVHPGDHAQLTVRFEADLQPGQTGAIHGNGLTVSEVVPGSPADLADLQGATLASIGGTRPTDAAHARQLLQGPPGSKVEIQLANGATLTLTRSRGSGAFAPGGIPEFSPSASLAKP